ncbi:15-hydroxyprostaglandin dehydrogenase [NAD(+)]-like [Antedon mediterranea]|uniref:15-hydroxyprostaglandin dehydrogenase [NAD(+)]-like n=1 Tax=Antedon mediterranea TaxID=105859 RepID=UPI003AF856F7
MSKENGGSGGVIINTGSVAGVTVMPCFPVYAATKHGVVALSRSLAANPKITAKNIRINAICPAGVDTEVQRNSKTYAIPKPVDVKFIP